MTTTITTLPLVIQGSTIVPGLSGTMQIEKILNNRSYDVSDPYFKNFLKYNYGLLWENKHIKEPKMKFTYAVAEADAADEDIKIFHQKESRAHFEITPPELIANFLYLTLTRDKMKVLDREKENVLGYCKILNPNPEHIVLSLRYLPMQRKWYPKMIPYTVEKKSHLAGTRILLPVAKH